MTTWTFGSAGSGLNFVVTIDDSGAASIHMIEGSMDLNALWFSDGDSLKEGDTSLTNNLSSLKMTGAGSVDADGNTITWDEMTRLSTVGLGSAGTAKITFLTAGETQSITLDAGSLAFLESQESLADITLGIRATSVNGTGGIKLNAEADLLVDTTAPTFTQGDFYTSNYKENQSANAVVAEITTATDDVAVSQYRFVSADGQAIYDATTADGYFSIDYSGKITITAAGAASAVNDFETGQTDHTYYVQAGDAEGNWSSVQEIRLLELDTYQFISVDGNGDATNPGRAWYDTNEDGVLDQGEATISKTVVVDDYRVNPYFPGSPTYTLDGVDFATDEIHIKAWQLDGGCLDLRGFTSDDRIELDLANMADAYGQKAGSQAVIGVGDILYSDSIAQVKSVKIGSLPNLIGQNYNSQNAYFMPIIADWGQATGGRGIAVFNGISATAAQVCVFGYDTADVSTIINQEQVIVSWPEPAET